MKALVVIPLQEEFDAMTRALDASDATGKTLPVGQLTAMSYTSGNLIVAQGGLGKAQFGVQTQHLINNLDNIGVVVCAGTCGRLDDTLSVGDVVVATQTIEHDFNRGQSLIKMPLPTFDGDDTLLAALKGVSERRELQFKLHFGDIASGDEGIASSERIRELRESTGAIVVAWEGAGGARAAQLSGIPFLEIRGISDGAGENAMQEFWANIPFAVGNTAAVVRELPALLP